MAVVHLTHYRDGFETRTVRADQCRNPAANLQRELCHRCAVRQLAATYTGTFAAGSSARPRT